MIRPISIGNESFRDVQVGGYELVDKTRFVEQICDEPSKVLLLPRPRRFGKTFGLSMLKEFFAIPTQDEHGKLPDVDARELFRGLYIESVWDKVAPHFQRYPTVLLTFKGMNFATSEQWWSAIRLRVAQFVRELRPLFGPLDVAEQQLLEACLNLMASPVQLGIALHSMTRWLHRGTGQKALVLIDEYDAPIQQAWVKAHELTPQTIAQLPTEDERLAAQRKQRASLELYHEVIGFFRAFLGNGLKGNESLYKAIITGVLRVSKESLFSDFNNPKIRTMLNTQYADAFGFTEAEVKDLFIRRGQEARLEEARRWYNGYLFGQTTLYNPWSILSYLDELPSIPQPYWLNTSENTLVKQLLRRATPSFAKDFDGLLHDTPVYQGIRDALSLVDIAHSARGLYNLLFFSGYLRAEQSGQAPNGEGIYALTIPNREVRTLFQETFADVLEASASHGGMQVQQLTHAILAGNEQALQGLLSGLAVHLISYLDGDPKNPEAFYQGLMLGLCAWLEGEYRVRSNRETGLGRADLLILPEEPGKPGALLELKSTRYGDSLESLIRQGERQIKKRLYAKELEALEVHPLQRWVVAFDGKALKVKKLRAEK